MPFLFDTDAISELLRPRPNPRYLEWVETLAREDQFTSAICIGELFKGAYRSSARARHLQNIEERVLSPRRGEGRGEQGLCEGLALDRREGICRYYLGNLATGRPE